MPERLSASNAKKHMACHASAHLELAIPHWTPPVEDRAKDNASNRGTNMHEILAKMMELPRGDVKHMIAALDYVAKVRDQRQFKVLIEQSVKAAWLTSKPDTSVDLVLYVQDEIHVFDWKTGKIKVEVFENDQLLYYAVAFAPLAPKAKGVHLHIVQPWADNMESWFADTNRLSKFMTDSIAAEAAILSGDTTFQPGDHCQFCPANPHSRSAKGRPLCPVMMGMLYPPIINEDEILSL